MTTIEIADINLAELLRSFEIVSSRSTAIGDGALFPCAAVTQRTDDYSTRSFNETTDVRVLARLTLAS